MSRAHGHPIGNVSRRQLILASSACLAAASMHGKTKAQAYLFDQSPGSGNEVSPSLVEAQKVVDSIASTVVKLSRDVWKRPAVGLQEHEAMELHVQVLEDAGFKIVSRKSGGHPTAFIAEWQQGVGGAKIGFLPEYDALPGLGNAAVPAPQPTADGDTDGHGCGHNCLGAGCTGAAIALKQWMERQQLTGTLRVYGCGAEENVGAKVFMAKAGLFDDLDAALAWHSAPVPATGTIITSANRKIRISWKGRTAHAGNSPWDGRSALDAAELFAHGVNLMREHVEPTARLHYVFERAGVAPNIVPDEAQIWLTARDITSAKVDAIVEWLSQLAQGAALGTQTKASFSMELGLAEMIPNETLARRIHQYLQHQPLQWSPEEQEFARECQKKIGVPPTGMATKVMPWIQDMTVGGSTDVGDVSWIAPIGVFAWPTLPQGVTLHSWPVTACGGMSIGDKGTLAAASILTAIGYDLVTDAKFREQAKEELRRRLDGRSYQAVIGIGPESLREDAKPFAKGVGEEYTSGI